MILTQPSRAKYLKRLLNVLDPQVDKFPGQVHVDVRMFDPSLSLGQNREIMRQDSMGDAIHFVDDDDLLAEDYYETILPLLDGVDYIGHRIQIYLDGRLDCPAYHSLKYPGWTTRDGAHYRDISHVNPMRRELALLRPMEGGVAEDFRWAAAMRETGMVKTEHYIDRALYYYYFRSDKSDAPPNLPVAKSETAVREEEVDLIQAQLGGWIGSVGAYVERRKANMPTLPPGAKKEHEVRLDELAQFEIYLDRTNCREAGPERLYLKRRRDEISVGA
jgi:hypothetical protein